MPKGDDRGQGLPANPPRPPIEASTSRTSRDLRAEEKARGLRAELARLRHDLAELRRDFSTSHVAEILAANEQLVQAALRAGSLAETAVSDLNALARYGQRDALTDTPNRALMLDRLENALAMAERHGGRLALFSIDLDHLKRVNDAFGHEAGDELLQLVARRLEAVVREADTVSRHGGDEFLVLLPEIDDSTGVAAIVQQMLAALAEPTRLGEQELRLSACLGISVYPDDGTDAPTLIRRADEAMDRAKQRGDGSFEFHRAASSTRAPRRPVELPADRRAPAANAATTADDRRLRDLREANECLVIAGLAAQNLFEQAKEENSRQIKFLAIVAHELRNPLHPILTAAEILGRGPIDERAVERVQSLLTRQVAHMSRLVDDLLDGTMVSGSNFRLHRSLVEMKTVLDDAVDTCRAGIDARQQLFSITLPVEPLPVIGDPVRLTQVFINVLNNASKYTPVAGEIRVAARATAGLIEVSVADNGIGISPEALPNIFELFARGASPQELRHGGLGIGLAVVRGLVEAHGGTVLGRSEGSGLGSEFVVTLPIAETSGAGD